MDNHTRRSPFMGYPMEYRAPTEETAGVTARPFIPAMEILRNFFGAANVLPIDIDLRALARDNFPSAEAGRAPHTMHHPRLKPGDLWVHPTSITGDYQLFKDVRQLTADICEHLAEQGVPMKDDDWRGYRVPDTETLADVVVNANARLQSAIEDRYADWARGIATVDSASKFTIQRYVPKVWFVQDMSANHVKLTPLMKKALKLFDAIGRDILRSEAGKAALRQVRDDYSDPFGTAVGWPLYASSAPTTAAEADDAKLAILGMFEGVGKGVDWKAADTFEQYVRELIKRVPEPTLRQWPLAYLVNRRSRLGGKWNPEFALAPDAAEIREVRGAPYARIAQAAPWLGNLVQGLVFPYFKAVRMCLTGCYHTTDDVAQYRDKLMAGSFCVESDISQYDLNLAIEVTDAVNHVVAGWTKSPAAALSVLHAIRRTPILIPAPGNTGRETGGVILRGDIMLPSGIKLTAEYGTLCNVLVTIAGQIERGMRDEAIKKYWFKPDNGHNADFLMQGDDKLIIAKTLKSAVKTVRQEAELYPMIGCTTKVEMADRFLQKHMMNGAIAPVAGRFLQQRLGNEHEFLSVEQLMVGTMSAASGLVNYATPGGNVPKLITTGRVKQLCERGVLELTAKQFARAALPQKELVNFVNAVATGSSYSELEHVVLDAQRRLIALLTNPEGSPTSMASKLLLYLERNAYSSTVSAFMEDLLEESELFANLLGEYEDKKRSFAAAAYDVLGIPRDAWLV